MISSFDGPGFKLCLVGKRDGDSREYNDPSSNYIDGSVVGDIRDFIEILLFSVFQAVSREY